MDIEQSNLYLENVHSSNLLPEQPFVVNMTPSNEHSPNFTQTNLVSDKKEEEVKRRETTRNVKTVKMYIQNDTKMEIKHSNSPSSIRRMKMEVNPLRYEMEPLI